MGMLDRKLAYTAVETKVETPAGFVPEDEIVTSADPDDVTLTAEEETLALAEADSDEVKVLTEAKYDTSPVGTPGGKPNWVDKVGGLPPFIRAIAHALIRNGKTEQNAIQIAVATVKRWAAGGGKVTAKTRAKAAATLAEWERKKGQANVTKSYADALAALSTGMIVEAKTIASLDGSVEELRASIAAAAATDHDGREPVVLGTWPDRVVYAVLPDGADSPEVYERSLGYDEASGAVMLGDLTASTSDELTGLAQEVFAETDEAEADEADDEGKGERPSDLELKHMMGGDLGLPATYESRCEAVSGAARTKYAPPRPVSPGPPYPDDVYVSVMGTWDDTALVRIKNYTSEDERYLLVTYTLDDDGDEAAITGEREVELQTTVVPAQAESAPSITPSGGLPGPGVAESKTAGANAKSFSKGDKVDVTSALLKLQNVEVTEVVGNVVTVKDGQGNLHKVPKGFVKGRGGASGAMPEGKSDTDTLDHPTRMAALIASTRYAPL